MRHSWDGREATGHLKLLNRLRVLFGFLSFQLHRRLRYEVYGPWAHFPPQPGTGADVDAQPSVFMSGSAAHQGAVIAVWGSDEDAVQLEQCVRRVTRNAAKFLTEAGIM